LSIKVLLEEGVALFLFVVGGKVASVALPFLAGVYYSTIEDGPYALGFIRLAPSLLYAL